MVAAYVAAIDQGTTGTRFMVFGHEGQVIASAYQEHKQIYPQPGWVEHDARGTIVGLTRYITNPCQRGNHPVRHAAAISGADPGKRAIAARWHPDGPADRRPGGG